MQQKREYEAQLALRGIAAGQSSGSCGVLRPKGVGMLTKKPTENDPKSMMQRKMSTTSQSSEDLSEPQVLPQPIAQLKNQQFCRTSENNIWNIVGA